MNVHFSYKSSKSAEVEREIQHQIEKLGKRLQAFRPELVHLHGGFEKNSGRNIMVSLNLRLPSGQLAAQETGPNEVAILKAAFHELSAQLNAHKDLLRNRYQWRRVSKEHSRVPFENTLAAVHPNSVSDGEIHSYINANIPKLKSFLQRELRYREANGTLPPNTISADEVLGEAVAMALGGGEARPQSLALEPWLYRLARRAIQRVRDGNREEPGTIHFEQPNGEANVSGSDEEYLQFHQPDDYVNAEELIPDGSATPEQITASDEFVAQIEMALAKAVPADREAFILAAIEGFSVAEIARISDRKPEDVRRSIETARMMVGKRIPGNAELKSKLLNQKLA